MKSNEGWLGKLKREHWLAAAACAGLVAGAPQVAAAMQASYGQPSPRLRAPLMTTPVGRVPLRESAPVAQAPEPYRPQPTQFAPIVHPQVAAAQRALDSRLRALGQNFNGDVGIAVRDVQTGWVSHFDGAAHFPQQSVSKFWVSLTAFDKADKGQLDLYAPVTVRKSDLTLFNQPIAALIKGDGYNTTLNSLIHRAITASDNTANDVVLWRAGGPDAVRNFLLAKGIQGVRFGPGERVMQARIAGMEWRPSMVGAGFYRARSSLPLQVRRSALDRYLDDPVDGATPIGIVDALTRLKKGELLSPAATQRLLTTMSNTKTGKQRLRGGLAPGWSLAHKTGTGQVLGGTSTGYNDIGIVTGPDGRSYAVAAMIRQTSAPIPQRMAMMQNVVRAVIDYGRATSGLQTQRTWTRPAYAPPQPTYEELEPEPDFSDDGEDSPE